MTTIAAPTPTLSPFPLKSPSTPSPALKPNPHPYPIKTTSTGVLSRSNSSGHAAPSPRHHYVPPPPRSPERNPKQPRNSEYRGHRYSKSLSTGSDIDFPLSPSPSPLPGPPNVAESESESPTRSQRSLSEDGASTGSGRTKRADTLPSLRLAETDGGEEGGEGGGAVVVGLGILGGEDLPSNPKTWTPSQLSTYLVTALRVRSADAPVAPIAAPVARDIAAWVRKESITGRTFLRWREEDLELLGINTFWRTALLNASRNLRQNVLRGRIWGTGTSPSSSPPSSPSPSKSYSHPFSSDLYASSSSSVDLSLSSNISPSPRRRLRARGIGRVKGLVDKWEKESEEGSEAGGSPVKQPVSLPPDENDTLRASGHAEREDEPSMEELLATLPDSDGPGGSWGARAWEAMDVGVTVKRVGEQDAGETVVGRSGESGSEKRLGSGGRVKGGNGTERRVVTAVFVPSPSTMEEGRGDGVVEEKGEKEEKEKEKEDVTEMLESALEKEVRESREMLEEFRKRLEVVETRVREMEEKEQHQLKTQEAETRAFDARLSEAEERHQAELQEKVGEERRRWEIERAALEAMLTAARSASTSESTATKEGAHGNGDGDAADGFEPPDAVSALPSYVLLVGLGVCAVVFKVVLRRVVAGRKS